MMRTGFFSATAGPMGSAEAMRPKGASFEGDPRGWGCWRLTLTHQTVNVNGANPSLRRNTAKQGVFSLFRIAREKLCPRLVPTEPRVPGFSCAPCAQQP
jgi:hypothetical protein